MDPTFFSEETSSFEEKVGGSEGKGTNNEHDEHDMSGSDDEGGEVPKSFDDLPSDDSVDISSSDGEMDDDDDEEVDMAVGDRLSAKRHGLADKKSTRKNRVDAKRKALSIASERLTVMRKKKASSKNSSTKNNSRSFLREENDDFSDNEQHVEMAPSYMPEVKGKSSKKRKSKHKPTEASSKRSDFFARGAPDINASGIGVSVGANRYKARDPRFQSLSGHYDVNAFEKKYAFLEDAQEEEIQRLKMRISAWKKTGRGGQKARRKLGLTSGDGSLEEDQAGLNHLMQKLAERRKDQIQRAAKRAVKKRIREEVAEGKRGAYYLKRSEQKRLEVEAEFDELRKLGGSGAVDKAVAKRRKKMSAKDKRLMPKMS